MGIYYHAILKYFRLFFHKRMPERFYGVYNFKRAFTLMRNDFNKLKLKTLFEREITCPLLL